MRATTFPSPSGRTIHARPRWRSRRLLSLIDRPADLRGLDHGQLALLAAEIRRLIVRAVSANGGHLGSNLGVVELTLALHRVFDSPRDAMLWDTGQQAYAHKIVTGRRRRFATLRRAGGLSGYPSRAESPHDWVRNSHASTILGYAHGLAASGRRNGSIVAVVGDGALAGGMAYEALVNLGQARSRVVIVLNDNGRSYSPTIGKLTLALAPRLDGRDLSSFFEALGVRFLGPVDGHDVAALEPVLRLATEQEGPVVVHALTRKGRGYGPAETDAEKCLHDAPTFDPLTGPPPWVPAGYTQVFAQALVAAGERDPRVRAITAAMAGPTGLAAFRERWPERVLDVGIAEQHAVTEAAGMAMAGLRPVVAVYSTFLSRAFDQVNMDVALHPLPVVFCIDRAGSTGARRAVAPRRARHGTALAGARHDDPRPLVCRGATSDARLRARPRRAGGDPLPQGRACSVAPAQVGAGLLARRVRAGREVCLLAVGKLVEPAEQAAELLARAGVAATVWDVRAVKPLDPAMLASALSHPLVVSAEDGVRRGGAGWAIQAALGELALVRRRAVPAVLTLGLPDVHLPHGHQDEIAAHGLDAAGIAGSVLVVLGSGVRAANHVEQGRW